MTVDDTPVVLEVDSASAATVRVEESLISIAPHAGNVEVASGRDSRAGRASGAAVRTADAVQMLGVLACPSGVTPRPIAVVIIVGGPQTRVGSHRQFVLLARRLAASGFVCLRFDYTGMGDSPGPLPDFEAAGEDIRRACDAVLAARPECRSVVLWGLCDGATAAAFHAVRDDRVTAVIAANPWARSDATRSAAMVQEHYGARLRSPAFWKKLFSGRVDIVTAAREFAGHLWRARGTRKVQRSGLAAGGETPEMVAGPGGADLPMRLASALSQLVDGPGAQTDRPTRLHVQLSGNDLTAAEFELAMATAGMAEQLGGSVLRLPAADHTFSDPAAQEAVIGNVITVLLQLSPDV